MAAENALMHIVNAWLVSKVLKALGCGRIAALLGAIVFAVHPLNVESVAWISQRKTQLAAMSCLAVIYIYLLHIQTGRPTIRWTVIMLYFISLLAKPWALVLPLILLSLDIWYYRYSIINAENIHYSFQSSRDRLYTPWRSILIEKWPLYFITLISSTISFFAQRHGGAVASLQGTPLVYRLINAFQSIINYLIDFSGFGIYVLFYPYLEWISTREILSIIALVIAISVICIWFKQREPNLMAGWIWFLVFLLPVIGLIQIGSQSRADRYMYLPMVGLIWIVAYLCESIYPMISNKYRIMILFIASIWISFLSIRTYHQVSLWKTAFLMADHTIQNVGDDPMAASLLASALGRNGLWDKAIPILNNIVARQPNNYKMILNLGLGKFRTGDTESAIQLTEYVRLHDPKNISTYLYLASYYRKLGNTYLADLRTEQYKQLATTLGLDPNEMQSPDHIN